ncbi:uncharacterized protein [Procambarus clarkii]|uniref:uncharacterized protein n=1 Tax=Procambarus clarkii TaxID=6728 RepID=UPI001E67250D|nr:uncharacterized protein LOC123761299 [Procambarus clarkii]
MDQHLYTTKGPKPTVLWLPGNGRSISPNLNSYRAFDHIFRTVHVHEALEICMDQKMIPKYIISLSSLNRKFLKHNHPCKNLRVLWFGTNHPEADEEEHNWYGNVEFRLPVDLLLKHWKYCFLVEIMSAPTHTATRLLLTNKDYSAVLSKYDPYTPGGPWLKTTEGHLGLTDCLRYNNIGYNRHGNTLEFMIEVTAYGQEKILENCEISFVNHSEAKDKSRPHVCHRFQKSENGCPSPFARALGSRIFFHEHTRLARFSRIAKPRLTQSSEYYLQRYFTMDGALSVPKRNLIPPIIIVSPTPLLNFKHQISQILLQYPDGLLYGCRQLNESCLAMGPLSRMQVSDLQYILAVEFNKKLDENTENGEKKVQSCELLEDVPPTLGTHSDTFNGLCFPGKCQHPWPNYSGNTEDMFSVPPPPLGMPQHNSCPVLFQHSWGHIYPGMLHNNNSHIQQVPCQNTWASGHPGVFHNSRV